MHIYKILTHNVAIEIITQYWKAKKYTLNDQKIEFCKYFQKIKKGKWHQMKFLKFYSTVGMLISIRYIPFPEKSTLCSCKGYNAKRDRRQFLPNYYRKKPNSYSSHILQPVFHNLTGLRQNYSLSRRTPLNDFEKDTEKMCQRIKIIVEETRVRENNVFYFLLYFSMSLILRYTLLGTKKTVLALKELKDLNEKHNLMI